MKRVGATLGHDIDRPARGPTVLDRPSVRHHLKLTDEFQRELCTGRPGEFVVVVESVDRERVAARAQSAETETTVRERPRYDSRSGLPLMTGDAWREQYEFEVVPATDRKFLDALGIDCRSHRRLPRVEQWRLS